PEILEFAQVASPRTGELVVPLWLARFVGFYFSRRKVTEFLDASTENGLFAASIQHFLGANKVDVIARWNTSRIQGARWIDQQSPTEVVADVIASTQVDNIHVVETGRPV